MNLRPLALALTLGLPGAAAWADASIEFRATEGGGASMQSMQIGHGKIRSEADGNASVIFDTGARAMIVLDHGKREYMRLGQEEFEQMAGTLNAAMAQMEQALVNVPPEMREQMEDMIGGAVPGMGDETMVKVIDTGRRDNVGGHPCTIYQTQLQGSLVNETCMGSTSVLSELSSTDRATLDAAMAMTRDMLEELATGPLAQFAEMTPFHDGLIPLRVTDIDGGRRSTSEFSGIDSGPLPAERFEIPSGYRQQKLEMPQLGR